MNENTFYSFCKNSVLILIVIYKTGLAHEMAGDKINAIQCYQFCQYWSKLQNYFFERKFSNVRKFLIDTSIIERSRLELELKIENKTKNEVIPIKKIYIPNGNEIMDHVDNIWGRKLDIKEINDKIISTNVKGLINSSQGKRTVKDNKLDLLGNKIRSEYNQLKNSDRIEMMFFTNSSISFNSKNKRRSFGNIEYETIDKDKKKLDPDEYFKKRICNSMKITNEWLEEADRRRRFRQDMIETIGKAEKNSNRSFNILKNFILIKARDNLTNQVKNEDSKKLTKEAIYDVTHKIYTIQNDLNLGILNRHIGRSQSTKKNFIKRIHTKVQDTENTNRRTSLEPKTNLPITLEPIQTLKVEQERKKRMTRIAEKLQRDIYQLEKNVFHDKGNNVNVKNVRKLNRDSILIMDYQNLANSIVKRVNNEILNQQKQKQVRIITKSKFFK